MTKMDPNETIRRLRVNAEAIENTSDAGEFSRAGARMAELFMALDEWLSKGGSLPNDWLAPQGLPTVTFDSQGRSSLGQASDVALPEGKKPQ